MEFSTEMNIYRESELSGDFEGEISKKIIRRALADPQPISPAGNFTYYPRTGTSLILCHMVVIEMSKISAIFMRKTQYFYRFFWKISRYFLPVQPVHKHDILTD